MSEDLTDLDAESVEPVVRRRPAEDGAKRLSVNWDFLAVAAGLVTLVVAAALRPAFTGSQNRYLLNVVARVDGGPITTDPLVRSPDPAPVFSALLRPLLVALDSDLVLGVLWVLAGLVFFGALWSITGRHVGRDRVRLLLWIAVVGLISGPPAQALARNAWSGFDGFTSPLGFASYLVPQTGIVLAVLGSVLAVRRQRALSDAALPLGVTLILAEVVLFPGFSVGAGLLVVALLSAELWGRYNDRAAWLKSFARVFVVVLVVGGVAAALNRNALTAFFGMSGEAAETLVGDRRVLPPIGLYLVAIIAIGSVLGAGMLALRAEAEPERRVGRFLICGGVLSGALTLVMWLAQIPMLSLLEPWYAFAVLVPLAVSYLAGRLAHLLPSELEDTLLIRFGLYGAAGLAIALAASSGARSWGATDPESFVVKYPKIVAALEADRPQTVGLIPADIPDMRLAALVAVSGDERNPPIGSKQVLAWHRGIDLVDSALKNPGDFCKLTSRSEFRWAVIPLKVAAVTQRECMADWRFIAAEGDLALAVAPGTP